MRNKTKHTPGPWTVDEFNTPNGKSFSISHIWDDGEAGEARTDEIAEVQMDYPDGVALANANLLAAAPMLLDACKDAEVELREFIDDCLEDPVEFDFRVVRILSAAIANAEGRVQS